MIILIFNTTDAISAHIQHIQHFALFFNKKMLLAFLRVLNHCHISQGQLKSSIDQYKFQPQFALERPHFNQNVITYLSNIFLIYFCMCTVKNLMNWGNSMSSCDLSKNPCKLYSLGHYSQIILYLAAAPCLKLDIFFLK